MQNNLFVSSKRWHCVFMCHSCLYCYYILILVYIVIIFICLNGMYNWCFGMHAGGEQKAWLIFAEGLQLFSFIGGMKYFVFSNFTPPSPVSNY